MHFAIHMRDPGQRAELLRMLDTWRRLTRSQVEFADWIPGPEFAILFWDLDDGPPPALPAGSALILCASSGRAAISSYAVHPAGFLRKPVGMEALRRVLRRCTRFWWDSLERLELVSDHCRLQLPISELVWAESTRRGCLIHSSREAIAAREPLAALEKRLPEALFLRCQRGFLVNLCHVRRMDALGLHMSDGAVVSLSRGSRSITAERYRQFCLLRDKKAGDTQDA